jgi:photosystem II stability/assembly factor-like uncharacterized protein
MNTGGAPPNTTNPGGDWKNVTANLAGMASECGNISCLSAKPDEDLLIVGVALHGLWSSKNGGTSWEPMGTGSGSDSITNRTSSLVFDPDHSATFWESGIYNAGGVYSTTDNGVTFHALGDAHHDDLVSVDFSDPARKTLLAGGHEQKQTLYRSTDGGATWDNVGVHLPAGTNFSSYPLVIDAQIHLVGCSGWGGGTSGIFRTVDGGQNWQSITGDGGVAAPLLAKNGVIYWPSGDGIARSSDQGEHFTNISANGALKASHPIELPDGRIVMLGSRTLMASSDGGDSWQAASSDLPYGDAVGVSYSVQQKAFFVWRFSCDAPVPDDAIMRFDFDYTKN